MFGISPMQLLIILVIVLLLFGTKKLRTLGGDLGAAVKGFKKAVDDKDADFESQDKEKVEDKRAADVDPVTQNKTESKDR